MICAHAYKWREWSCKWSYSSSVKCLMRLQSCEKQWASALLSVKCCCFVQNRCERVTQLTSPSEEEEKEGRRKSILAVWWLPGSILSRYFRDTFRTTGQVVHHKNTPRWTIHCYKGLQVYWLWGFLRDLFDYNILHVCAIPIYSVYWLYDNVSLYST